LSVISCQLSVISYQLSVINYQLSTINYQFYQFYPFSFRSANKGYISPIEKESNR